MADASPAQRPTWSASFAWVVAALWLPHLVALALSQRVRRIAEDIWFWPGMIPGNLFFDDLYTRKFGAFTLLHLLLWTAVCRRRKWLALGGAFLCSALAAGRMQAMLAV
ncbi:MAG: hypothetical protein ACI9HE_003739 [Planctomycetota bacterium]|jgi:hypothetical protein